MSFLISKQLLLSNTNVEKYELIKTQDYYIYYNAAELCRYFNSNSGNLTLICVGTPMYKSFPYDNVLEQITQNYLENKFDIDDVKGNYCLIFIQQDTISFYIDKTGQHSVFYDTKTGNLSNSLMLLLESNSDKYTLNRMGLYEKIAIGFNIGEDTIFEEIVKLTHSNKHLLSNSGIVYNTNVPFDLSNFIFHQKGKTKSLQAQVNQLSSYFQLINQTFSSRQGDLGLSGGFDCRLVLSLAQKCITNKLHLHTHYTKGVHEKDSHYAENLGKVYGMPITKVATTSPSELSNEDLEAMLEENMRFFDLRSARHLGAYSQTYTAKYKKESMKDAFYSLNGLGGEIYRDSYFTGKKKMNWDEWADRYLFLELTTEILPKEIVDELKQYLKKKIHEHVYWDKPYYDIFFTHAYYGLIKMPQCNGNLVAAYSKVSPFLVPFFEYDNVIEALKAIPYLGIGGQYQAALINKISPELAQQPNHYGNSFSKLGLKYLVWSKLKTMGSAKKRQSLVTYKLLEKAKSSSCQQSLKLLYSKNVLKESFEYIKFLIPEIKIDLALVESTQRRSLIFIAFLLKQNNHRYE